MLTEANQDLRNNAIIDEQLQKKAELISMFMGGDYDMTVGVGPYGSGWHWDFVKNHVNMDAKDLLESPEDVVKGVAAHEGNHRLVSRPEHVQDLWQQPGFSFGFNACEDPRANQGGIYQRPGSKDWIKSYIERDLSPGGGLDYKSIQKDTKDKLGYVPKFMQWGGEMINYWHEKEFNKAINNPQDLEKFLKNIPDEDVRKTAEKTITQFEEFYETIPHSKDENDVQIAAKKSCDTFRKKIWPQYKELVEKSINDQSMAQMIQDMIDNMDPKQSSSGNGKSQTISIPFSSLPQDIQDEIKEKIENQKGSSKSESSQSGSKSESNSNEQNQSGQGNEGQEQKNQSNDGDKNSSSQKKVPWDQLSDKAKEEVEKKYDQLSPDQKNNYQQQAEKDLKDSEDSANEKLRGQMSDPRYTETHQEQAERQSQEEQQKEMAKKNQKIIDSMEKKRQEAINKVEEDTYFYFLNLPEVAAMLRQGDREFKKIFKPNEQPNLRFSQSGLSVNMKKAMQMEADPRKNNIFEVKGKPETKNYRFLLLVDLSGSMADKIDEILKTIVRNSELLNKHGIEFAILGFSDNFTNNIRVFKSFDDKKLTLETRHNIGEMRSYCDGGTPTLKATVDAYKNMLARMNKDNKPNNYLITLTDGNPTDGSHEELLNLIKKIRKDNKILTAGYGFGPSTEFVNQSYPELHHRVKQDIARTLKKNVDEISNSFQDSEEFNQAFDIILMYMVKSPELFVR